MTAKLKSQRVGRRQTLTLSLFLLVQTVGMVFFVGDVFSDFRENPASVHFVFEATVTAALVLGILFGTVELRRMIELLQAQEQALDVAEIAELRGAAQGTVRAQLTRIYSKAGVSGRAQFAAFFVEDLLGQGVA